MRFGGLAFVLQILRGESDGDEGKYLCAAPIVVRPSMTQ